MQGSTYETESHEADHRTEGVGYAQSHTNRRAITGPITYGDITIGARRCSAISESSETALPVENWKYQLAG